MNSTKQDTRRRVRRGRVLIPAVLVLLWLAWTSWGGQTFGNLSEVTTSDQAAFLPVEAESTRAMELQEQFTDNDAVPATIVAATSEGEELPSDGMTGAEKLAEEVSGLSGVVEVIPPQPAEDGAALQGSGSPRGGEH